jgi:hypothetical protein
MSTTLKVELTPIDYERLKIANDNHKTQLLERQDDVATLKIEVGMRAKMAQGIRDRVELHEQTNSKLADRIVISQVSIGKTAEEKQEIAESIAKLEIKQAQLQLRLKRNRAPTILEFVQMKEDLEKMKKQVFIYTGRAAVQKAEALKWKKSWTAARLSLTRSAPASSRGGGGGGEGGARGRLQPDTPRPGRVRSARGDDREGHLPSKDTWKW